MIDHTGPGAPAGGPRTGPSPRARRLAALAALAAMCGLGVLSLAWLARADEPHPLVGLELPRFEMHTAAPCSRGGAGAAAVDFEAPGVLLFISNACPHCRAQLRAWESLIRERGNASPWVVLAPGETLDTAVTPARLRHRVALDRDARIARLLDARRVPLTVYVDRHRRVAARVVGRQSGAEMAGLLRDIGLAPTLSSSGDCP